ncbi:MAG: PepSY domain-containing protein [Bacteroidota bacterium]
MGRLFSVFFSVFVSSICFGQISLAKYRSMTDSIIKAYFSSSVFRKANCTGYFAQEAKTGNLIGGKYEDDKSKEVNIELITMFYSLKSEELKYEFGFSVSIDSNSKIYLHEEIFDIPVCVRMGKPCYFITKERAIARAQKDSIQYFTNLIVEMKKPKNSEDYYWVVSGQDKRNVDYSIKPKDGWQVYPKKKSNTRYLNAKTGEILSYDEYQCIDKKD